MGESSVLALGLLLCPLLQPGKAVDPSEVGGRDGGTATSLALNPLLDHRLLVLVHVTIDGAVVILGNWQRVDQVSITVRLGVNPDLAT